MAKHKKEDERSQGRPESPSRPVHSTLCSTVHSHGRSTGNGEEIAERIHGRWIYVALLFIAFHLTAVFAEPLRFFSRSNVQVAPNAELVRNIVRPYSQFLFLDHGYFFFAPNPGPGHLIRILNSSDPVPTLADEREITPLAEAKKQESNDSRIVQLPDRNVHWPRLLYHRYLMLADFYYNSFAPPEVAKRVQEDERLSALWKRDREIYTSLKESLHQYGKSKTTLPFSRVDRVERELADLRATIKDKVRISDIRWLYILPEVIPPSAPEGNTTAQSTGPGQHIPPGQLPLPDQRANRGGPTLPAPSAVPSSLDANSNRRPQAIDAEIIPAPR